MGPVIDQGVVERFRKAVAETESSGGTVLAGGEVLTGEDYDKGNFVQPTVVTAPYDSWIWQEELFMPFLAVGPVESLDEGLRRSNETRVRADRRVVLLRRGRDRALVSGNPGRGHLRQPDRGCHDRSMAQHPVVRRMEGIRDFGGRWRRPLVPPSVPAGSSPGPESRPSRLRLEANRPPVGVVELDGLVLGARAPGRRSRGGLPSAAGPRRRT